MIDGEPPTSDEELERAIEAFIAERGPELGGFAGLPPEDAEPWRDGGPGSSPAAGFELVRRIGEGGMGIVFEARQRTALGRRVAVKLLRPFTTDAGRERFQREIETVLSLDHPGIVPVVAAEVHGASPFLAMKLVDGVSLTELLAHLREVGRVPERTSGIRSFVRSRTSQDATPPPSAPTDAWREEYYPWAAQLVVQVCDALQHAHDRGVVHRDVKPGNLLLTPEGRAILLDFGIAATEEDATLTRTGDFVGTLHYSAPEQAAGQEVDGRADVYSAGATLYELLTLRRPHEAASPAELLRHGELLDPPALDRAVPADLRTVCRHALAGDRARRYSTPAAMAADLRAFLTGAPILARPPGWPARARRAVRRHPRATWLSVAAFALAFLLARAGLSRSRALAHVRAAAPLVRELDVLRREIREERRALARWIDERDAVARLDGDVRDGRLAALHAHEAELAERADAAKARLSAAFALVPDFGPARRALADVEAQRVRAALDAALDVLDPPGLAELERELVSLDREARHADLLARAGLVALDTAPSGVAVSVQRDGGGPVLEGVTPLTLELEEGSYVARASHPDGGASRLPFLVRRAAVHASDARALPPPALTFELLPASARRAGFLHVPAGWTLMGDDPPRWRRVAGFEIQELEVSFEDYLEWLRSARPQPLEEYLPRGTTGPFVVLDETAGALSLRAGIDPRWPVLGLHPDTMHAYADQVEPPRAAVSGARYVDLPDPGEWLRAARGADARAFARGSSFDWASYAGYFSRADREMPRPYEVGSFPGDVSPFGVRDLTGSIAELQGEYRLPRHGGRMVRGGSYASRTEEEMRLLTRRATEVGAEDIGLRLVRRPVPAWMAEPDREPAPFFDDFERPDGDVVGNGWREVCGDPRNALAAAWLGDLSSLAGGRLVCEAEVGQFSAAGSVYRRLDLGERFRVQVTLSYQPARPAPRRSVSIGLRGGFDGETEGLLLAVAPAGVVLLKGPAGADERRLPEFALGEDHVFEIEAAAGEVRGRVWRKGGARPTDPLVRLDLPRGEPLRFLVLAAQNLVGGRVEVDEVAVTVR